MKKISICFVTDDNYAPYMGVAITSILKNAKKDESFDFYIFDNGIKESTKAKLNTFESPNVHIKYVDISTVEDKFIVLKQTVPHISKASYFKFVIADLLPNLDRIIYLDGDLIVKESLWDLYNIDLGDNLIAAVEDVGYTYWSQHNEELKLKFKCMNSGVMLINCDLWRKENLSAKLLECAADHDKVGFGQDQPVLNYVLKDRVKFIDFKWNAQDTFFRDEIELKDRDDKKACKYAKHHPAIIHYTYVKKPWNYPTMRKADEYWNYYKDSPFFNQETYKKAIKIRKDYYIVKRLPLWSLTLLRTPSKRIIKALNDLKIEDNYDLNILKEVLNYLRKEIYDIDELSSKTHIIYRFMGIKIKKRRKNAKR